MPSRFIPILISVLAIILIVDSVHAESGDETDISGTWIATTPEDSFTILSVPNRETDEGYIFLMLELGDIEKEFGFRIGEQLATLSPMNNRCWIARERFHFPLWAGGGFYVGETMYCAEGDDILQFHTDDDAAVFSDYPLHKQADGIDAAGIWQSVNLDFEFEIILFPLNNGHWLAWLVSGDGDPIDKSGLSPHDCLYRGDDPPNADGVDAEACVWSSAVEDNSTWLPMIATLENSSTLKFEINQGSEIGTINIDFTRVY